MRKISVAMRKESEGAVKLVATVMPYTAQNKSNSVISPLEHLRKLAQNADFKKELMKIREDFGIPHSGKWYLLGVTDKATRDQELLASRHFKTEMALLYSDSELAKMKIKTKSRKDEFEKRVCKLRQLPAVHLPHKYQKVVERVVMYGGLSRPDAYFLPYQVHVYQDKGECRLFVEIFGDTKPENLKGLWRDVSIEALKKKHKIAGAHLRSPNYFKGRAHVVGAVPRNSDGTLEPDYDVINKQKTRFKKRASKL